ncbi:SEC-C metal-binding domain-containing protein [Rhodococcus sp. NPDC059968]|uniref:SEC-C metal-binding domain-containing protein n=1 Tax=Rhodococcus sp. NPDC059968 TaxID=3347017 RepID=UPI00366FF2C0
MVSAQSLTADDLERLGNDALHVEDPLAIATGLVAAVEEHRLDDRADEGFALLLAAEIHERAGNLDAALQLSGRGVEAQRVHGDRAAVFPEAFHAELLLRLGREDEGMSWLQQLRPLLTTDLDAAECVPQALIDGGHPDVAERWLTDAVREALTRRAALEARGRGPGYTEAASIAFHLLQVRHHLRGDLGLPHDAHDHLADELRDILGDTLAADTGTPLTVLYWPQQEFAELVERWPGLSEIYGGTWDDYRQRIEMALTVAAESGCSGLGLCAGSVDGLVEFAGRENLDPMEEATGEDYAEHAAALAPTQVWPPGRNETCWCGSGRKYKKCCLPRARSWRTPAAPEDTIVG